MKAKKAKGHSMGVLPFCVTGLMGGFAAYLVSLFGRGQVFTPLANYPIGVLTATLATWISQNVPALHNKLFLLGIFVLAIALLLYRSLRHFFEQ